MHAKRLVVVAAIATTLGGVFLLLGGISSSRRKPLIVIDLSFNNIFASTHDDISIDEGQPIHHAIDVVSFYEENEEDPEEETTRQEPIEVGDMAELYGPNSQFATPVIVNRWENDGKGGIVYSLVHADARQEIPSMVDSSYVHRYEPYPGGTDAVCTLDQGLRKEPTLSPCRVIQHTMSPKGTPVLPKDTTSATYQVTFVNVSGENVEIHLPFAGVFRVLRKRSLAVNL